MANSIYKTLGLIVAFGLMTGQAAARPDEAEATAVADCRFLGNVAGNSGYGKNLGWQSLAKASAENRAGQLGATHVVFTNFRPIGSFNGEAAGKAYACSHG